MWNFPGKSVFIAPETQHGVTPIMQFRLTYEGEVPSSQSRVADAKMRIRKSFHVQLKRLWSTSHVLRDRTVEVEGPDGAERVSLAESLAREYREFGYRFVPLAHRARQLHCQLEILLLRNDGMTRAISAGDLDNRVKTVIDALKRPRNTSDLGGFRTPEPGEDPFYVLLEDDELVSGLVVETGDLLSPTDRGDYYNRRWAKVLVTAKVVPYHVHMFNSEFLSD